MSYKRLTERTKHGIAVLDSGEIFVLSCGGYATTKALNRLAELEDKIEQKKMLELPFLVGQDAFIIENNEIVMGVVNGIWWQDEFLIEVRYNKDGTVDRRKTYKKKGISDFVEGLEKEEVNLIVEYLISKINNAENNNNCLSTIKVKD